ncbi:MAG: 50S ribosomal protein L16 [Chlamydiae bacterium RIFCSPHIGHO2_12_FULL_44_59]|nr:MAG: 50S ribosomal protein L16 [Chlamydiae bacterium RIFCSPHIGHO2_01_FULL_44_39]OGN58584.1 MAG: 50S ribosomal protein L16 [Chlamydiae bacterium RIFCSPHIGHO2_02_FULL_45_9]OGN60532.1 MAG: 50S ribosomal protein L16 [Chlamydiae bacterium RIFCSPHIGHO2_12_FULL_44_59]OGN65987.1 MAG: 50S ribosomal protein L16 [Chlamydiae bacterium RIFCSPLOWO2_01_FULL_44_52]OGN68802.1 MAG: 50S ribosomal protein L16 [Chlamydiae bacterium RIFCSPLOWO2_02_FULL_45_22]OGN70442.1 MAG: 50S ribosomal protein L16 [Chlamydiae 
MALSPKKTKHRKQQKGKMTGLTKAGAYVEFGDFGMQSLDRCWLTARQIEACRVTINRTFSRKGQVWIRVFPDKPVSKKPAETRMGKGKGAPDHYVAVVRPGRILFEVGGVTREEAQQALRLAAAKLPIRTKFVDRLERV